MSNRVSIILIFRGKWCARALARVCVCAFIHHTHPPLLSPNPHPSPSHTKYYLLVLLLLRRQGLCLQLLQCLLQELHPGGRVNHGQALAGFRRRRFFFSRRFPLQSLHQVFPTLDRAVPIDGAILADKDCERVDPSRASRCCCGCCCCCCCRRRISSCTC